MTAALWTAGAVVLTAQSDSATGQADAQPLVIGVDEAVAMAVENNIQLQMNELELATKKRTMQTVWNRFLPSIRANIALSHSRQLFGEDYNSYYAFPNPAANSFTYDGYDGTIYDSAWILESESEPATALSAGLSMSLPLNLALASGIRQTVIDYQGGQLDYHIAQRQLELDIRKQFWLILTQQASIELDERNLQALQRRYDQTLANYQNGLVPEISLLSARVSLENARPQLAKSRSQLESSIAFFKFLLGVDQSRELQLDGVLDVQLVDLDAGQLIDSYLSRRLDIQQMDQQIRSLENTKTVSTMSAKTPNLVFGLNYGTQVSDEPFSADSWDPFYDSLSLSVALDIPIDALIPGSQADVGIAEIQDGIDSLRLARAQVRDSAMMEIEDLVRQLDSSKAALEAYEYNVELAQRSYEMNSAAYRQGTTELLEVEDSQDSLQEAQFAVLYEKYNYLAALLDLEYAVNTSIDEILGSQSDNGTGEEE